MEGEGEYAGAAKALFDATCKKLGLNDHGGPPAPKTDNVRRPPGAQAGDQMKLF